MSRYFLRVIARKGGNKSIVVFESDSKKALTAMQAALNEAGALTDFGTETDGFLEYSLEPGEYENRIVIGRD